MTIQLAPEAEAALDAISTLRGGDRGAVLSELLLEYKSFLDEHHASVTRARADFAAGRVHTHDEVIAHLDSLYPTDEADLD